MLTISVNNQIHQLKQPVALAELLKNLKYPTEQFVVAVNGDLVPRNQHQAWLLKDRDQVDILTAVQGG